MDVNGYPEARFSIARAGHAWYNALSKNSESRDVNVYLPYGYDESRAYNVFYFMHGTNETQESFICDEKVKNVVDNMIEVGAAEPFIMVCPTYYYEYSSRSTNHAVFVSEVRKDLMPAVESTYHTFAETPDEAGFIASREHRAFGGYSQGSAVTWTLFSGMIDTAKWFVPMSGGSADQKQNIDKAIEKFAGYPFFLYIACGGKRDIAYDSMNALVDALAADAEHFSYGADPHANNLYYCLSKELHQTLMSRFYFYNAFEVVFR